MGIRKNAAHLTVFSINANPRFADLSGGTGVGYFIRFSEK
jgi:hypothetical protein